MKFLKKHGLWIVYAVVLAVYAVKIVYLDENNLIKRHNNEKVKESLEIQKQYYLNKISTDRETISFLKDTANKAFLEKFAREHYYFKMPNEDIFVIRQSE